MGKEALAESVRSCESPTPAGTLGAVAAAPRVTPCPPRVPPSLHGAVTAGPWPGGGGRRRPCRDRLLPARPCRARGGRLYSTPVPPHVWAPAAAAARRLLRAQPGKNNNNKKKRHTHTKKNILSALEASVRAPSALLARATSFRETPAQPPGAGSGPPCAVPHGDAPKPSSLGAVPSWSGSVAAGGSACPAGRGPRLQSCCVSRDCNLLPRINALFFWGGVSKWLIPCRRFWWGRSSG